MKTPFVCTVALASLLATGSVQAGPGFDLDSESLGLIDVEPVDMDVVRHPNGSVTTRETYLQPDGTVVTRTTVREPMYVPPPPPDAVVELTPAQRRLIWHSVAVPMARAGGDELSLGAPRGPIREHIEAVPGPRPYRVGSRIPGPSSLQPLPETVTLAVPSMQDHLYAVVDERVLVVDPVTNTVVAEVLR